MNAMLIFHIPILKSCVYSDFQEKFCCNFDVKMKRLFCEELKDT